MSLPRSVTRAAGLALTLMATAMLAVPAVAAPPPTLTGEQFAGTGMISGNCSPTSSATFSFSASGTSSGPYAGTFTESGTYSIGPQGPNDFGASLESFQASFTVTSPTGTVTGTKTLDVLGPPQAGRCFNNIGSPGNFGVTYEAQIQAGDCTYTDRGHGFVSLIYDERVPTGQDPEFFEGFTSTLAEPELVDCTGPNRLTLAPSTATNTVGEQHCVTATVSNSGGGPEPGVVVTFAVGGANSASGSDTTDSNGEATFCYTGTNVGDDTISAFAGGSSEPDDTASKTWIPGDPAMLVLMPAAATNTAGDQHCVTATVSDFYGNPTPGVSVVFSASGANSAGPTSATTNASGEATFCYTGTTAGDDTITAFADSNVSGSDDGSEEPDDQATKTYVADAPAALDLSPPTATNKADEQHCVTATVTDQFGNPTSGITVEFSVSGSNTLNGSGSTNASGEAQFCYTSALPGSDTITATAQGGSNPSDTATKTWAAPLSTRRCKITNGGRIEAANGDRASFGGNAHASNGHHTLPHGNETYQDHGPAQDMFVKGNVIKSVVCSTDGTDGSIFASGRVDGVSGFQIRIDVKDLGEPGNDDTYRIRVSNGYDSGEQTLESGNVQIHK